MADLTERLRPLVKHLRQVWRNFPRMSDQIDAVEALDEAADALEAMQKEVSYLRTRETNHMAYIAELEEQLDNEREAALFWQAKARTHDDAKQTLKGGNDE